ncbi:MAG TPA: DUF2020 domain-containing protein [Pseudonocardiaceae bacterium]|nr:DUF2020 domain-containing protein [Pseudonocardiaceae bacterium]
MRRALLVFVALLGLVVGGCGPETVSGSTAVPVPTGTSHGAGATSGAGAVGVPSPPVAGDRVAACPYLHTSDVADANGQHVGAVKVSSGADGQPHPACFFYRPDGSLQMTVWVYVGTASVATAIVNQAAPVATSDPATDPAGWNGGSLVLPKGAVYAVSKGGDAIVVTSNQLQTIKCRLVADLTVTGLGL